MQGQNWWAKYFVARPTQQKNFSHAAAFPGLHCLTLSCSRQTIYCRIDIHVHYVRLISCARRIATVHAKGGILLYSTVL